MVRVFISHAHSDEALARRIAVLLRDALNLDPSDFFLSSQGGRGVAPAANIREEIFTALSDASALIVLVTPQSAGRPWVWLEAGHRLGRPDRTNPLFLVPSERYVTLLQPVADLRCICLDHDDDLIEMVNAVGANVGKDPVAVLSYKPALGELVQAAKSAYSAGAEQRLRAMAWARRYGVTVLVAIIAVTGAFYARSLVENANQAANDALSQVEKLKSDLSGANEVVNVEVSKTAARYLQLKGVVNWQQKPVNGAHVIASLQSNVPADCEPPVCSHDETTTAGEFLLDLTKIGALKDDDIVLRVSAPDFEPFSKRVKLDVRAIDVSVPAHTVDLTRRRTP